MYQVDTVPFWQKNPNKTLKRNLKTVECFVYDMKVVNMVSTKINLLIQSNKYKRV